MAKKVKRSLKGLRYQRAHNDGALRTIKRNIEKTYDLPPGSVQLVKPDGRKMRENAKVSRLRRAWD
jgi:hypothetical protein